MALAGAMMTGAMMTGGVLDLVFWVLDPFGWKNEG